MQFYVHFAVMSEFNCRFSLCFLFCNELKSWPTGRRPSATWWTAQLARCGLHSWRRRPLYPSTAPMPAGENLKSVRPHVRPTSVPPPESLLVYFSSDPWSWFTSVTGRCRVSRCSGMWRPRPCSPMGLTTLPTKASVPVGSPVCSTSAVVALVSLLCSFHNWLCLNANMSSGIVNWNRG